MPTLFPIIMNPSTMESLQIATGKKVFSQITLQHVPEAAKKISRQCKTHKLLVKSKVSLILL